jgi:probable rRNA maturation factor
MIFAELNQQILRGGQRVPRVVLDKVLKTTSKALGLKGRWGVSIAFVDRRTMRRLNRAYRGQDRVTDVLSFHLGDDRNLGEIILCYDRAATQAKDIGHTVRDEIVFLIVHGLLHLCGYDHTQSKDAKKMFLLQTQILTSLHINTKV